MIKRNSTGIGHSWNIPIHLLVICYQGIVSTPEGNESDSNSQTLFSQGSHYILCKSEMKHRQEVKLK